MHYCFVTLSKGRNRRIYLIGEKNIYLCRAADFYSVEVHCIYWSLGAELFKAVVLQDAYCV